VGVGVDESVICPSTDVGIAASTVKAATENTEKHSKHVTIIASFRFIFWHLGIFLKERLACYK
jgi:hypothetical protein